MKIVSSFLMSSHSKPIILSFIHKTQVNILLICYFSILVYPLKGIYDVAKITSFCVFGVMQYVYAVQKHIIFHILYIIVAPMPHLSEKQRFYKANRSEKRGVL